MHFQEQLNLLSSWDKTKYKLLERISATLTGDQTSVKGEQNTFAFEIRDTIWTLLT